MATEATAFAARHSMDSPEWYTPSPFVEAARKVMGGIDLDPASHEEANRTVKAARFFTEQDNGLAQMWSGRVFLNPPGGLVSEFWVKLLLEVGWCRGANDGQHLNGFQAIWIGYSLEQLQTLQCVVGHSSPAQWPICITSKRIAFVENEAKQAARLAKLIAEGEMPGAPEKKRRLSARIRAGYIPPSSPSHSNYITYIGPNLSAFAAAFSQFGVVRL
jgi:hypothetical protein